MKVNYIIRAMRKLPITLILLIIMFSCKKENESLPRKTSGKINTISVIIDDQLWNGDVGDSIRNKFASPVIGLPQEEPRLFVILLKWLLSTLVSP